VIAEPHPVESRRTVWFDLKGPFDGQGQSFLSAARDELENCRSQGEALWALLGGAKDSSTFDLFTRLLELNRSGLFDDVLLRLRRHAIPVAVTDAAQRDVGVMRYEELSDGEQMFMGRMALFHLLSGRQDSLLLLDEPETHFNDLWKRDVVSVVDDALANTSADVLIATHASLMLTDALKEELVVLERTSPEGDAGPSESGVRILDAQTHTFGATGDHPLRDVFGAPDTVGKRASRLLEVLVATAQVAAEVDEFWGRGEALSEQLIQRILHMTALTEESLTRNHIVNSLASFERFALHFGVEGPLTMKAVLETFIRQTGPGYFQVELKRAWRRILEVSGHAA
jgi:energy-coupling factor transporter ATP-binding protein EcfA2